MTSIVSGPSRTADIEKTLVLGAHGPKQIFVFYIEQDKPL
jgi:L-lactate dehydrogenase complex protein LldG